MDDQDQRWMARAFASLANENRLAMFKRLRQKELECNAGDGECSFTDHCCNVSDLAAILDVTQATVSHHLKELNRAGLVDTKRQGRFIYCYVNESTVERLEAFLRRSAPLPTATL